MYSYKKFISRNLIVILFILSFALVFSVSFYTQSHITFSMKTMEYNVEQRLIAVSQRVASLVTPEELDQYRKVEDMALPAYQALRQKLQALALEADVLYAFYIRPVGARLQFIVDNDVDEATRVGLDTEPFDIRQTPWIIAALGGKSACSGLGSYTPGWEGYLTAYSPVFDDNGGVAAIAGVDIHDESIVRAKRMVSILALVQIISVLGVFVSGCISMLLYRSEAEKARAASAAKSAFLAQTSHEIRTPMNAIIGMGELALRADTLPRALEYVENIKQAGLNLLSLLNDILDFSKIEAGNLQIVTAPYSLASLLNDVINIIRQRVTEKPVTFIADVDASIPNRLVGDLARLRQVLLNLLSNAVKYTNEGHIRFTVRAEKFSLEDRSITLVFEITDTGIGIREKDIPHLFKRFTRLDMKKNQGIEGTGLGLAITHSLCQAMHGSIGLTSKYGKGSVFTVRVPQIFADDEPLAAVEDAPEKTVLCCERRVLYAESIVYTLGNLGVRVQFCTDEKVFFRELEQGTYTFAFTGSDLIEQTVKLVRQNSISTTPVLLANPGESPASRETPVMVMPVYAVPVANVLNYRKVLEAPKQKSGRFTAPDAKILVVDDISTNLVVTAGLLAAYQSHVDTCTNGAEAIAMVQQKQYDMVFMDHMMPVMDGIESTRHIRNLEGDYFQRLPIIALTANAISGMREMFLDQGFNDYLSKPIETSKLDRLLEIWIPADKQVKKRPGEEKQGGQTILPGDLEVEGIDLNMGIERYGEEIYLEVLRSYAVHTPVLLNKLRSLAQETLTEETVGEYTITSHGLKGSTYGICANDAAKEAETLEKAARSGDLKLIKARNPLFVEAVEKLLENIQGLLEKAAEGKGSKSPASVPDPALLTRMLEACKQYKTSTMEEVLARLESFEYESGGDLIAWLREQADNLEYDAIRKRLESLVT